MPLITITQDYGSHGYYVAQQVAKNLQLHLYDDEHLRKAAIRHGVKTENLDGLKEHVPGFFDQLMHGKKEVYLDVLQNVVYQVSSENNSVIVGHGSQLLLRDFGCALHVRIITPKEKRIKYFIEEKGLTPEQARKIVKAKDEQADDFFRYAFKMDINDPLLYDLVINTNKLSIASAISHITDLARSNEIIECGIDSLKIMECRAQEIKLHARLVQANVSTLGLQITVAEPGRVKVHGIVKDSEQKVQISNILEALPEFREVELSVVEFPING